MHPFNNNTAAIPVHATDMTSKFCKLCKKIKNLLTNVLSVPPSQSIKYALAFEDKKGS